MDSNELVTIDYWDLIGSCLVFGGKRKPIHEGTRMLYLSLKANGVDESGIIAEIEVCGGTQNWIRKMLDKYT